MKVLIQDGSSMEYFGGEKGWVRDDEAAVTFESSAHALTHILQNKFSCAWIVLKFPDAEYDCKLWEANQVR